MEVTLMIASDKTLRLLKQKFIQFQKFLIIQKAEYALPILVRFNLANMITAEISKQIIKLTGYGITTVLPNYFFDVNHKITPKNVKIWCVKNVANNHAKLIVGDTEEEVVIHFALFDGFTPLVDNQRKPVIFDHNF